MDVLIVGGGGRESALAWKLAASSELGQLWVTHDNPGFPRHARRLPGGDVSEQARKVGIDLVVVGPEGPLADGLADRCRALGVPVFGPSQKAAQLEASKGFAKDFMIRHNIPTAVYSKVQDLESAHAAITGPCVVKADGLAAGKGVYVCENDVAAHEAVDQLFGGAHGEAGASVVIEALLTGPEVSVLALCDGERFVTLPVAQDHKRRFEGDQGPNTGGMGAYAPVATAGDLMARVEESVIRPTLAGMAQEGRPFVGVLYVGLMLTESGPRVLEYNGRFGDPECQPLLMLLDEDLLPLLHACAVGDLAPRRLRIREGATCCVVMVSGGYPGPIEKGQPIEGLDTDHADVVVFQSGTSRNEAGELCTNGGRVLGVTAWGQDVRGARDRAYEVVGTIGFKGADWRKDIAWRALEEQA
jgi:phosphoribosylamine--glycine ligase